MVSLPRRLGRPERELRDGVLDLPMPILQMTFDWATDEYSQASGCGSLYVRGEKVWSNVDWCWVTFLDNLAKNWSHLVSPEDWCPNGDDDSTIVEMKAVHDLSYWFGALVDSVQVMRVHNTCLLIYGGCVTKHYPEEVFDDISAIGFKIANRIRIASEIDDRAYKVLDMWDSRCPVPLILDGGAQESSPPTNPQGFAPQSPPIPPKSTKKRCYYCGKGPLVPQDNGYQCFECSSRQPYVLDIQAGGYDSSRAGF